MLKTILKIGSMLLCLSIATLVLANSKNTDEHVVWQRTPINITLPVSKERLVTFPSKVTLGIDSRILPANILRIQNDNRTLYFLAKKSFSIQRIEAKLQDDTIILLDISAQKNADDTSLDIVLPKSPGESNRDDQTSNGYTGKATINYVSLTRFAIQQLYAPKRLLTQPLSITRFPMESPRVVPLFYDNSVLAMPLASWRGNDLYVMAILIKNLLHEPLHLDARLLCGKWQSATFYPQTTLEPHGSRLNRDTATLFLTSTRPFLENMRACFSKGSL